LPHFVLARGLVRQSRHAPVRPVQSG
jgi:hypothetical protein